jgi:hypothetical protein
VVNVKSAMARFGPGAPLPPAGAGNEIEYIAWFRFPVTWNYLCGPPPQAEPRLRAKPVAKPSSAMVLVSNNAAPPLQESTAINMVSESGGSSPTPTQAQWEMVIPKMVRPAVKPVADRITAPPVAPAPALAPSPLPDNGVKSAPAEFSAPAFALPEQSRLSRSWRLLALLTVIMLAVGFTLWVRPDSGVNRGDPVEQSLNRGGWSRRSILPAGRMLSVYEASREESDYRIEFAWVPDAKGVGWVFRTRDAGDYYATRISLLQPGARAVLVVEHFSVFGGVEGSHSRRVVPLGSNAGLVRVRMDAIGPAFTLSLQGSPADYWTDARLDAGPLGFYDERGQRPEVQSLRFTFVKKGAARTAVASLP